MAENKEKKLNLKQQLFCGLYASDKEFFGNGAESYIEAYSTGKKRVGYQTAVVNASKLLTNTKILERIDELMNVMINNTIVDKELAFVVIQKANLPAKVAAIKEWNLLQQRIIKKLDITSGGEKITQEVKTDPLLKKAVEFYEKELKEKYRGGNHSDKHIGVDKKGKDKKRKRRTD